MQSVGSDTSPTGSNCTWRSSDRYLNHSQLSIVDPEVYKPTGSPAWLVEELNTRLPPMRKPSLQVTNWNETDWEEPIYGPSAEDLADLIEREREWDKEQQRPKPWRPLRRFASLKKELAGGIKQTISLGKKKGFEPRLQPVRTLSEKQVERPRGVMRSNTIGAAYVRRWSIQRQKNSEEGRET
ncbi:hypothetical protein HBI24_191890 [Parastagonospora nodorum]|nr:hypothetical protein HBI79_127140 [Parastagonospora nodorum]KAH5247494.1 hypothetical protein HBI71_174770 [Parastagonospora nodorum]KAH5415489.1 hypothetical protein HBI47_147300 [Parastagonospora nodorum]KAH5575201.1 hypothetical protein HBI24_191890 [Parastagonospora nodorum]KAH5657776.1 hypothetical protein HBI23_140800 [Parastagonospora nodorum]